MAKSYEQEVKAYKATCRIMAGLEILNMNFQIYSGNAESAGVFAARAARWIFTAYPEFRELIMANTPHKGGPSSPAFQEAHALLYRAYMEEPCHTNRAILNVRMDKSMNPKGLPARCMSALINEDRCPNCLGELDTGWECNSCGYDATPWMAASKAINDATHDRREA